MKLSVKRDPPLFRDRADQAAGFARIGRNEVVMRQNAIIGDCMWIETSDPEQGRSAKL